MVYNETVTTNPKTLFFFQGPYIRVSRKCAAGPHGAALDNCVHHCKDSMEEGLPKP